MDYLMSRLMPYVQNFKRQNFGANDSIIASSLVHPYNALLQGADWFKNQVNTAAGMPVNQDEASMYAYGPSREAQAQAGINLAGLAQTGSMPFAPKSAGGTLGTLITPQTKFSIAHDVAKRNAALPVEQGGLGLHPDNTAMDRARALGFNTEAYHGTASDINEFDPILSSQGAAKGPGVYVTELPDDASRWAGNNVGSNVMPLLLNKSNVLPLSELSSNNAEKLSNFLGRKLNEGDSWPGFSLENRGSLSTSSKNAGFSGADHAGPSASRYIKDTVITDPSIIRSRFAAFDPMKKNSGNILASVLAGTTLASQIKEDTHKKPNVANALRNY